MTQNYLSMFTYITYYGKYDFGTSKRLAQKDETTSRNQVERSCKTSNQRTSKKVRSAGHNYAKEQPYKKRCTRHQQKYKEEHQEKTWFVIGTNCVISALIRDSLSRRIITDQRFFFITPEFLQEEIEKHKELILKKSNLTEEGLKQILNILFQKIIIVNHKGYDKYLAQAQIEDKNDIVFVALAIAKNLPVWSDDKAFKKANITTYTTQELMEEFYA